MYYLSEIFCGKSNKIMLEASSDDNPLLMFGWITKTIHFDGVIV